MLKYLKYSQDKGIKFDYQKEEKFDIVCYTDADWAGDKSFC
jgi:hypothetical protein